MSGIGNDEDGDKLITSSEILEMTKSEVDSDNNDDNDDRFLKFCTSSDIVEMTVIGGISLRSSSLSNTTPTSSDLLAFKKKYFVKLIEIFVKWIEIFVKQIEIFVKWI